MAGGIRKRLAAMGLPPIPIVVFLFLKDEADSNEDLRTMASWDWIIENTGYSRKVVRMALKELEDAGLIKATVPIKKRAAIYTILHRGEGLPNGLPKGLPNESKKQIDSTKQGLPNGLPKGPTGVTAVKTLSEGVGVDSTLNASSKPLTQARVRVGEPDDTAWLAPESQRREETAAAGPPPPIEEFREWVKDRIPNWAKTKAQKVWREPDDKMAIALLFQVRALHEIQACWQIFIRPGTRQYDYASKQRFSMREFRRQIEFIVNHPDYPGLKRRYMMAGIPEDPVGSTT